MNNFIDVSHLKQSDRPSSILRFRVGAFITDDSEATNHIVLFVELNGNRSVRIQIKQQGIGRDAELVFMSKPYTHSQNMLVIAQAEPTSPNVTVQSIMDTIEEMKRYRYRFAKGRKGCRWWTYTVMKDFQGKGLIKQRSAEDVLDAVGLEWAESGMKGPTTIVKGQFY
ncbi:hypothetical protein B0I35DRAFT_475442 [Stachybotrys elegans]|uniref:DUF7770 domain-containing protein n=1 Tax=Stachybotrys elegans TaxID=80388 RepID=A0A8K0T117_9HYPO|nr:hypothetical protein B0I35DRAFT_475442 [Stachybotrys elegans]